MTKRKKLKIILAINLASSLLPLVVALVTVPIYLRHIGPARYGVLSIIWLLLGYFGFLDLGLSKATSNALARLHAAPQPERGRVLVTALIVNLGLGCCGAILLFFVGVGVLQRLLTISPVLEPEIRHAFPWVVALFPLAMASGVGIGALESRERFGLANILQLLGGSAGQILPALLSIYFSPTLDLVIPVAVVCRGLTVIATLACVFRLEGPLRLHYFDRSAVRELLRYGSWVTVSSIISPILNSVDQFLIGTLRGVSAVAYYAIAMNFVVRSQVFASALSRSLFPRISSLNEADARDLCRRAFEGIAFSYGTVCVVAITATPLFFRLWLGATAATASASIAIVLFLGAWFNAVAFIPFGFLEGQGRPEVTGKFHAIEVLPFLVILGGLTHYFGVMGAAWASVARFALDGIMLTWVCRLPSASWRRVAIPCVLNFVAALLAHVVPAGFLNTSLLVMVMGAVSAGLTIAHVEDYRALVSRIRLRRIAG